MSAELLKDSPETQPRPASEGSASVALLPLIDRALKLGGFLYVLGFAVIMVHTSSLHIPVVEALQVQNILAGWPIGLAMWLVFKLWPWVRRAVKPAAVNRTGVIIVAGGLVASVLIVRAELLVFARGLSIYSNILLFSGIFFAANLSFLYSAYNQKSERMKSLFEATCVYSLVLFLVLGYAILGYPNMPQAIGGGRPEQIRLYFHTAELSPLLGGSAGSGQETMASDPVYLYYRTSSYLLISKDKNSDQPLIQVPMDQVRAVVWLQSHSKP
jgi:hypothetical protein